MKAISKATLPRVVPRHQSEETPHPRAANRLAFVLAAVSGVVYLTLAGVSAWRRPLWNDELFTYYIGNRPTLHDVWQCLLTGVEQLPPLFYVIIRASVSLFGLNELGLRAPEIAGVGVAALCVWLLVGRRAPAVCAAAATFFFLATSAYSYAYEARPYGLVLGFSGVALVCWQRLGESNRLRPLVVCGLGASLTAAFHSHYYAILILGPIGTGQFIRDYRRRQPDIPVWLSLSIPAASLLLLTPLLRAASAYKTTFWGRPTWSGAFDFYLFLLNPRVIALVALGVASLAIFRRSAIRESEIPAPSFRVPLDEIVAMAGLLILPFAAVLLGKTITGAYAQRYVLPATIGLAVLAGWGLASLTKARPRAAFIAALMLLGCFIKMAFGISSATARDRDDLRLDLRLLEDVQPNLPIAIASPHLYFKLAHYATPPLAGRLYYLADPKFAVSRTGSDTAEVGVMMLSRWAPLRVMDYREFLQSHSDFLIYGHQAAYAWLVPELMKEPWRVSIVKVHEDKYVLRAGAKEAAGSSE